MKLSSHSTFLIDYLRNNTVIVAIALHELTINQLFDFIISTKAEIQDKQKQNLLLDISNVKVKVANKSVNLPFEANKPIFSIDKIAVVANRKQNLLANKIVQSLQETLIQVRVFETNSDAFMWL
ncbi:MAG: hypothetical protein HOG71_03655 [Bacteroidetes bacterium]|jgi:hypothetical protein|nr:hypothetical protein [Bacteroidota bacterium]MBT5527762.1 hypothetical protein [Cytophagia bacterium]MBT5989928.1 hypothetical protein [Bacteroidota bacterium]